MIISTRSNLLQSKSINAWTAEINKPVCLPISSRKGVKENAYEPGWPRSCLTLIFPVQKIRCARMRGQASLVTRENEISETGKKNISWIQPRGQFCFLTTWSFRSRAVRSIPFFFWGVFYYDSSERYHFMLNNPGFVSCFASIRVTALKVPIPVTGLYDDALW